MGRSAKGGDQSKCEAQLKKREGLTGPTLGLDQVGQLGLVRLTLRLSSIGFRA